MSGDTAEIIDFQAYAQKRDKQALAKPAPQVSDRFNHLMHHTLLTIIDYVAEKENMPRQKIGIMLAERYRFKSPMDLTIEQMDDAIRFLIDYVDGARIAH